MRYTIMARARYNLMDRTLLPLQGGEGDLGNYFVECTLREIFGSEARLFYGLGGVYRLLRPRGGFYDHRFLLGSFCLYDGLYANGGFLLEDILERIEYDILYVLAIFIDCSFLVLYRVNGMNRVVNVGVRDIFTIGLVSDETIREWSALDLLFEASCGCTIFLLARVGKIFIYLDDSGNVALRGFSVSRYCDPPYEVITWAIPACSM